VINLARALLTARDPNDMFGGTIAQILLEADAD
jgi:hypothetical protein